MLDVTSASKVIENYLEKVVPVHNVDVSLFYSSTRGVWWCLLTRKWDSKPLGKLYLDNRGRPAFTQDDIGKIINAYRTP